MANHISALKRVRQTRRRTDRNRRNKGILRSNLRQIREVLGEGNPEKAQQQMPQAFSRLDQAIGKGILHRNTAARLKSRFMKRLHALERPKASQG
ncbi:MAG: 30S ribosomal protein S20 [Terriglobia bacterium]